MLENVTTYTDLIDLAKTRLPNFDKFLEVAIQSSLLNNPQVESQCDFTFEKQYLLYLTEEDQSFEDHYYNFVIDSCFSEFMEWYEYIVKHLMNQDVQQAFGLTPSNIHMWWAFRITNRNSFLSNIEAAIETGNIMKSFFNSRRALSTVDNDYFESDHAQIVLDTLELIKSNDRCAIIDQLETDIFLLMLEVYGWNNTHNYHILQYLHINKFTIQPWN